MEPPNRGHLFWVVNGHLQVLQWARSQDPPCPWKEWTCTEAAAHGHLNERAAVAVGAIAGPAVPLWDEDLHLQGGRRKRTPEHTAVGAISGPALPLGRGGDICDYATRHPPMLKWVRSQTETHSESETVALSPDSRRLMADGGLSVVEVAGSKPCHRPNLVGDRLWF